MFKSGPLERCWGHGDGPWSDGLYPRQILWPALPRPRVTAGLHRRRRPVVAKAAQSRGGHLGLWGAGVILGEAAQELDSGADMRDGPAHHARRLVKVWC